MTEFIEEVLRIVDFDVGKANYRKSLLSIFQTSLQE
jgi:hypothetical protein